MSSSIVVSGSLAEVRAKLQRMKAVIEKRAMEGYSPTLPEFDYKYAAYRDACPECLPLNGLHYAGSYIMGEFSEAIQMSSTVWVVDQHDYCRCELQLQNASEACVTLLARELEAA